MCRCPCSCSTTCPLTPTGTQMVIFSPSETLTLAIVTSACVASTLCVLPVTLASDVKLDSHSAFSPSLRGGISEGGEFGSNVRWANITACLTISGFAAAVGRNEEEPPHPSTPTMEAPNNTKRILVPEEATTISSFILRQHRVPAGLFVASQCPRSYFRIRTRTV